MTQEKTEQTTTEFSQGKIASSRAEKQAIANSLVSKLAGGWAKTVVGGRTPMSHPFFIYTYFIKLTFKSVINLQRNSIIKSGF